MKKLAIAAFAAILLASPALAQEYLHRSTPATSETDTKYAEIVQYVFREAYQPDVIARAYDGSCSSVIVQVMTVLTFTNGRYRIKSLGVGHSCLYPYADLGWTRGQLREHGATDDYRKVVPDRCEIAISDQLGKSISDVWRRMLLKSRKEVDTRQILDGYSSVFAMPRENLEAEVYTPDGDNEPSMLAEITGDMDRYCNSRSKHDLIKLTQGVDALQKRLDTETSP